VKSLSEKGAQELSKFRKRVVSLYALGRLSYEDHLQLERKIDELLAYAIEAEQRAAQAKEGGFDSVS